MAAGDSGDANLNASARFLAYHEPNIVDILTLISFFFFLSISGWIAGKTVHADLIGHIVLGLVYGVPLGNILGVDWQETFLALGYIGLILIIFKGGLTIRLDLLRQNFVLSIGAALLGVLTPIALSFALLYAGFGHGAMETFVVGTALSTTSLGTTFVVIKGASAEVDFSQTRVGTVLVSAAVLDDVCGLVLVSVIHELRTIAEEGGNLGWIIGRPLLASGLLALVTPLVAKLALAPLFRRFAEVHFARHGDIANIILMVLVLSPYLAIAAYAGASVLFGAFLAGTVISSLPTKPVDDALVGAAADDQGSGMLSFLATFDKYVGDTQKYILQPLFFASIGFAIPFLDMWTGEMIWKGVLFSTLMTCGKLVVGLAIPAYDIFVRITTSPSSGELQSRRSVLAQGWAPATLLGTAMVPRGEIGLLIIQIGLNETPFLSQKAFIIGVWAIILNTIIGPVAVGFLLKRIGNKIAGDPIWGIKSKAPRGSTRGSITETSLQTIPPSLR
ncbi:Hsp70 ATPase ssc1 [Podospora conica]|nr:Hsp70 ATPase ssc1 [Schizothecium conicum]